MIIESLLVATITACCSCATPMAESCDCCSCDTVNVIKDESDSDYFEDVFDADYVDDDYYVSYEDNTEDDFIFEPALDYECGYADGVNAAYWEEYDLPMFKEQVELDMYDLHALYNCVEHEVGGCSQRSKYIVTASIINRYIDGWESTVYNVITSPNQYQDIFDVLYLDYYATQDTIDCVNYVLSSGIDYADGATSFYNRDICGWIDWFENQDLVAELDGHRYFRL